MNALNKHNYGNKTVFARCKKKNESSRYVNNSNVENCKKKNLQNSLYVIAIYLHWMCK